MQQMSVRSLGWEDPLEEEVAAHPVFLPGKSHGLAVLGLSCSIQIPSFDMGSCSLIRYQTQAPCIGSVERGGLALEPPGKSPELLPSCKTVTLSP